LSNGGFILIKKNEYKLRDHFSALDVLDQGTPQGNGNRVTQRSGSASGQLKQERQSRIRNHHDSHSSLINTQTLPQKVLKDELEVTSTVQRERPNVKGQDQRKRPTTKQVRIVCMILYSYNEKEPRFANNVRTNCMKGYSLRQDQFSELLMELVYKGVYRPKRVGKGREKGQFVYEVAISFRVNNIWSIG